MQRYLQVAKAAGHWFDGFDVFRSSYRYSKFRLFRPPSAWLLQDAEWYSLMGHVAVSQGTWSDVQLCFLKLALVREKQRSGLGKKDIESPSHLRLKLLGSPGSRLLQNHLPSPRHLGRRNQHRLGDHLFNWNWIRFPLPLLKFERIQSWNGLSRHMPSPLSLANRHSLMSPSWTLHHTTRAVNTAVPWPKDLTTGRLDILDSQHLTTSHCSPAGMLWQILWIIRRLKPEQRCEKQSTEKKTTGRATGRA